MKRSSWPFLVAVCLWIPLASCGGSGGDGGDSGQPISGTINTDYFNIPAGQTRTVVGDLKVVSTGKIDIDGTLIINEGFSFEMESAGAMSIKGTVKGGASKVTRAAADGKVDRIISDTFSLEGSIELRPGWSLEVLGKKSATIATNGVISTPNGRKGAARKLVGESSGGIAIASFGPIHISGTVRTGDGGDGGNDLVGEEQSGELTGQAGKGGNSGEIKLVGESLAITPTATVKTGDGGDGGLIQIASRNGSANEPGQTLVAIAGGGGNAGHVLKGEDPISSGVVLGVGGAGGPLKLTVGNGGANAKGGDCRVWLANPGTGGDGRWPPAGELNTIEITGGRGGASNTAGVNGGAAGKLKINTLTPDPIYLSLTINNAFNGGDGFSGCDATPQSAGTNGGEVPELVDYPKLSREHLPLEILGKSFAGGNGGSGLISAGGPGKGAAGGKDAAGTALGLAGEDGTSCGESAITIFPPPSGYDRMEVRGATSDGTVLVMGFQSTNPAARTLNLWKNGVYTPIDGGSAGSLFGWGINEDGTIVGQAKPSTGPEFAFFGRPPTFTNIFPGDTTNARATMINDAGTMVAQRGTTSTSAGQPFLINGSIQTGIEKVAGTYPSIQGINNTGTLVGSHGENPITWTNGVMATLPLTPNATGGGAMAINDNGVIAGYNFVGSGQAVPVVWISSTPTALPLLGQPFGLATTVASNGVVAGYQYTGGSTPTEAIYWINGSPHKVSEHSTDLELKFLRATQAKARDFATLILGTGLKTTSGQVFGFMCFVR